MTREEFESAVLDILETVPVMTLATCATDTPWATDVYFARTGFDLVYFSSSHSCHCRNLAANPACAATVHPLAATWQEIRGVQMQGEASPITGVEAKMRATAAYLGKFPFARELMSNPSAVARKMAKVTAHVFRPSRIRYLDNSLGFGARFTLRVENGELMGTPKPERDG